MGAGLPVTAKLSGRFYERFGDEITNELVDWFNAVDTTYQAQVREINESNREWMQARFGAFDARMDGFEQKMIARMDAFEARIEARLSSFRSEMILWMFGFWSATVIPVIGLMLALNGFFSR